MRAEELPHYTYSDYLKWEGRWELIEGVPFAMVPAPSIAHQTVSSRIAHLLEEALADCPNCQPLLPVDWKISDDTIVQPDNLVVCYPASGEYLTKAPVLIFEIASPSTESKDRNTKFRLYEQEGVRHYCLVYPHEKLIKVFELQAGRYLKRLDATEENIDIDLGHCRIQLNSAFLWN